MSGVLTAAVEAAAVYQFGVEAARLGIDAAQVGQAWEGAEPIVKHAYRESVLGAVTAAAPVIEAQVRAQVAAQIEAYLASPDGPSSFGHAGLAYHQAARIARGESS